MFLFSIPSSYNTFKDIPFHCLPIFTGIFSHPLLCFEFQSCSLVLFSFLKFVLNDVSSKLSDSFFQCLNDEVILAIQASTLTLKH